MAPLDPEDETVDLGRMAAPALNVAENDVILITKSNVEARYIWTDLMCPEGVYAKAIYRVEFKGTNSFVKGCTGKVSVAKTYPTGASSIPVKHKYEIEVLEEASCLE